MVSERSFVKKKSSGLTNWQDVIECPEEIKLAVLLYMHAKKEREDNNGKLLSKKYRKKDLVNSDNKE